MRNIIEYPITKKEILEALDKAIERLRQPTRNGEMAFGSIDDVALACAKDCVEACMADDE